MANWKEKRGNHIFECTYNRGADTHTVVHTNIKSGKKLRLDEFESNIFFKCFEDDVLIIIADAFENGNRRWDIESRDYFYDAAQGFLWTTSDDFTTISPFQGGISAVNVERHNDGDAYWNQSCVAYYVDKAGRRVFGNLDPGKTKRVCAFDERNGLAAVQYGALYGFIDFSGQFVIKPQFTDIGAGGWEGNRMLVKKKNFFGSEVEGVIDNKGNFQAL